LVIDHVRPQAGRQFVYPEIEEPSSGFKHLSLSLLSSDYLFSWKLRHPGFVGENWINQKVNFLKKTRLF